MQGSGAHEIIYIYTDEFSSTNSDTVTIQVKNIPISDFSFINACAGDNVTFTGASTTSETGDSIVGWTWDFGDASSVSNTKNTGHSYTGPGVRNVKLTVDSFYGCSDFRIKSVDVGSFPNAQFDIKNVCLGDATRIY